MKVLVPVDGSENAQRALAHVVGTRMWYRDPVELHVVNVQRRIASGAVRMFISQEVLNDYYREEGEKALAPSRQMLSDANVPFE
ncbi:MAG TPA: universal stress protein, partial [Burkholderiales bacterium]|nr:universal stress protein [Burkholderiales bacterium]